MNQQTDIDKIYLYAKDPNEPKYQFLINKLECTGLKYFNDSETFIRYSNDMDDIYKNIEEYYPSKKRKMLIVFDYMIPDMLSNKKLNPLVTESFVRCRKLIISLAFITQTYFAVTKNIALNSMHYFIIKISKFHLIVYQILTLKTLLVFTKNALQNLILFYFLMLLLHQIILHVSGRIFWKEYKN